MRKVIFWSKAIISGLFAIHPYLFCLVMGEKNYDVLRRTIEYRTWVIAILVLIILMLAGIRWRWLD